MGTLLFALFSASLFSLEGLGQDNAVFSEPFTYIKRTAYIEFTLRPEWTVLREGSDVRSVFWSNPFHFNIAVPVYKGIVVAAGNRERFNQSFDVFLENENLILHVLSRGGIEEAYATLGYTHSLGEIVIRGSYLFGNTFETWDYRIENYNLIDTFLYKYSGLIFNTGVQTKYASGYFESFGTVDMTKPSGDTALDIPSRFGIKVYPPLFKDRISIGYEYSWWKDIYEYQPVHRFSAAWEKDRYAIEYRFNPWYLDRVQEHELHLAYAIPLRNLGLMRIRLESAFAYTDNVQEFTIAPQIELSLRELFMPRRK